MENEEPENLTELKALLQLESQARRCDTIRNLGFYMVNFSKKILPYSQCYVWRKKNDKFSIEHISATTTINRKAPYILFLEKKFLPAVIKNQKKNAKKKMVPFFEKIDVSQHEDLIKKHKQELPNHIMFIPFISLDKKCNGGIMFYLEAGWIEDRLPLMRSLIGTYQHCWYALSPISAHEKLKRNIFSTKKWWILLLVIILALTLIDLPQTVLVPAEIAPKHPELISSSIPGTIAKIYVEPNQIVDKGDLLFSLDKVSIENKYQQAQKELILEKERLRRAHLHGQFSQESKGEILLLKTSVAKIEAKVTYTKTLLQRTDIHASKDGMVIFTDPRDWLGKPIEIGERIMLLSDPEDKQLDFWVPMDDLIPQEKQAKIIFYSNPEPLKSVDAHVKYITLVPKAQEDKSIAYYGVGTFTATSGQIGLKGTAKIYGRPVSLFYYLFRRPIAWIQQSVGL
jgi:hypothetical protein